MPIHNLLSYLCNVSNDFTQNRIDVFLKGLDRKGQLELKAQIKAVQGEMAQLKAVRGKILRGYPKQKPKPKPKPEPVDTRTPIEKIRERNRYIK